MEIRNFDRVRIGDYFPVCFDVSTTPGIACVHADINLYSLPAAQLREKAGVISLFVFAFREEMIVPEWWEDSKVIWEWKNPEFETIRR